MKENATIVLFLAITRKGILAGVAAFLIVMASAQSGPVQPAGTGPVPKPAEQVYKNIQVLKGIPADELIPSMQFIAASLGVECDFCHAERAFDKDDKKPKQAARKMIQMMLAINQGSFDGHREVTCYSCHRGSTKPVGTPIIGEEELKPVLSRVIGSQAAEGSTPGPAASAVAAEQILARYVQVLGGEDAIRKVTSRAEKGMITAFSGQQFPVEVFAKAPGKRVVVTHLPNGDSVTGFDGRVGWVGAPGRPVHEISSGELEGAKLEADFYFPLQLKQIFAKLELEQPEKIADREVNVVSGFRDGQPFLRLYFDQQSGLLVRLLRYAETPLGRNPMRIDYTDYRDQDGVKIPYRWVVARPSGRFTIQITEVEQNIPVDDAKFSKPATESANR
jgi:photosynthetic reaction center cytochrome c subunit